jgi:hypothetical protein
MAHDVFRGAQPLESSNMTKDNKLEVAERTDFADGSGLIT